MVIILNIFYGFIDKTLFINIYIDAINLRQNRYPFDDLVLKWSKNSPPIYVNIQPYESDFLKVTLFELFHNSLTQISIPVISHSIDVSFPVGPFD